MKLLGTPKSLSKIIREVGEDAPKVENGLMKATKEAEVAGEVGARKAGAVGERNYNTIDVEATDLSKNPKTSMGKDEAGFPQLKSGEQDPFALKSSPAAGGDGVDVPFDAKNAKSKVPGQVAVGAATLGLGGAAAYYGMDNKSKFPAKNEEEDKAVPKVGSSGPAVPDLKASPMAKLPSSEKYKEAYNALKLPDQAGEYAAMQGELAKDINAANDIYAQTKDQVAAREMWDGIIKGIGHIAAGVYGQNTGLDLSGVKFDQTDWDKKRELAQGELRDSINNARMKNAISKDQIDRSYSRAKDQLEVDKSQIEAAERRDMQSADLQEKAAGRKDQMAIHLAEMGIKAREAGDKDTVKKLAEFKDMENKLETLATKWTEKKGDGLKSMFAGQVQQYQAMAEQLGIPVQDQRFTMDDLNSSDNPENVHNASMKRMATPKPGTQRTQSPPAGKTEIMYQGKPAYFDPATKTVTFK